MLGATMGFDPPPEGEDIDALEEWTKRWIDGLPLVRCWICETDVDFKGCRMFPGRLFDRRDRWLFLCEPCQERSLGAPWRNLIVKSGLLEKATEVLAEAALWADDPEERRAAFETLWRGVEHEREKLGLPPIPEEDEDET
jgi:hypothetical protein